MLNTLNLLWGVQCFYYSGFNTTDETIEDCTSILKNAGFVKPGEIVINTGSMPMHKRLRTNMLKVTMVD
jgi:pyruvate kinase